MKKKHNRTPRPQAVQLKAKTEEKRRTHKNGQAQANAGVKPAGQRSAKKIVTTVKTTKATKTDIPQPKTHPSKADTRKAESAKTIPPRRKVPEALPLKSERTGHGPISRFTSRVFRKPAIQEIVREPTAGGIVYRLSKDKTDIEILLIQDSKGRWTIPKGHIEPGETAKQTAVREIGEESGLFHIQVQTWLGKIHFQYRRVDRLVLMTTQIYLVRALDDDETPIKEQWMKGIKWFKFNEAIDAIEYEDIEKLMLLAKNKIRQGI